MKQEAFRTIFEKSYKGYPSFKEDILTPVFGEISPLNKSFKSQLRNCEKDIFEDVVCFGQLALATDGDQMQFFDVTLKPHVMLSRNKVTIQNFIRRELLPYSSAIIVFHALESPEEWRISFVSKGSSSADSNSAKRYTYLVGKNQSCRTAAEQFDWLSNQVKTLENITKAFSVEVLTKQFYNELFQWYQWALSNNNGFEVTYPNDISSDTDDRKIDEHLIRLITRLMFVWFIKQKSLIPEEIFNLSELNNVLMDFDPQSKDSGNYYNAILQNLFFATLNKPINEREFASSRSFQGKNEHYGIKSLFRDAKEGTWFKVDNREVIQLFSSVPFLNGGLFECLDKEDSKGKIFYYDGYSRAQGRQKRAFLPNCLFFDDKKGLIPLLQRYNFTVEENSPNDVEVALDPELLGKVFENLLGAFNPETKETARKQSGSFYTPREIVNYMVDESLIAYLNNTCPKVGEETIRTLFTSDTLPTELLQNKEHTTQLALQLKEAKILDPACGSGAFPMGVLSRMLDILKKLDIADEQSDYELKLELIENCIYGVDIQTIAVQISKLRFFISLICEQEKDESKENFGIIALPNLETKFVAANTLIGLTKRKQQGSLFENPQIEITKQSLLNIRHKHFSAKNVAEKTMFRKRDKELREELAQLLEENESFSPDDAKQLALWNPYDQNESSPFFDPEWMFGLQKDESDTGYFDVVIGNPPYVSAPAMVNNNQEGRLAIIETKRFTTLFQKWDLYIPFMELGMQLLEDNGVFTMIVPYPFTNQTYAKKLRELILSKYKLIEIVDLNGTKVFENATVSSCIPIVVNSKPDICCYISHINENKEITRSFSQLLSDLVQDDTTAVWNLSLDQNDSNRHTELNVLGDFCYISVGMVLNADEKVAKGEFSKSDLISETYNDIHCRKYIEAKDIEKYKVKRIRYLEYNTSRCPDKLRRPTFRELYNRPKLLFNCLGDLMIFLDQDIGFLHNHSLYSAVLWKDLKGVDNRSISGSITRYSRYSRNQMESYSEKIDLAYLLGILNSNYASILLSNLRGGDYHIYPEHLRNFPIPLISKINQQRLASLAKQIISAKSTKQNIDTTNIQKQIDNLVYKLYNLTYDEIKVIEPDIEQRLSEAEYNAIEI